MVDPSGRRGRYYLITSDNSISAFDAEAASDNNPLKKLSPRRVTIAEGFGRALVTALNDATNHFNRTQ